MVRSNIKQKFGERVRYLRTKESISQEELGYKAKIHRTYIGSVERGEQNVSIVNIEKIATALNVSLSDLFNSI